MRIVIVDPDDQAAREVAAQLGREGLDVSHAGNPAQLEALLRARAADVVICDLSRRRMNGFDIARRIHSDTAGRTELVLISPTHEPNDAEVQSLMADVGARFFYTKPLDASSLLQGILTPRPTTSAPQPPADPPDARRRKRKGASKEPASQAVSRTKAPRAKPRKIDWDNARALVAHWVERDTGMLVVQTSKKSGRTELKDGGVVDPTALGLIEAALAGAQLDFEPGNVDGVGDWALLGNQVFAMARAASDTSTILGYMNAVPVASGHMDMARALAITGPTRRLLGAVDGKSTIAELIERTESTPGEISADMEALVQLALVALHRDDDNGGLDVGENEQSALAQEISTDDHAALKSASESADLEGLPVLDADAIAEANRVEDPESLRRRLEREIETISSASPPVVLGLPAGSTVRVVDKAAARMRRRYDRIAADERLPDEVRGLATQLVREIHRAHKYFDFSVGQRTGVGEVDVTPHNEDEVSRLLDRGRVLMSRSQWSEADRVLTQAHQQQLDHAGVLSNLGWTRIHNPNRNPEKRAEEGRDFLLLAEQFDAHDGEGQFYLAQILLVGNNLEGAALRAQRAMDAFPGEPTRAALHRKIQVKLAAAKGDTE